MRFALSNSKHALYFLTALTAAVLLLFTLLANADDASAQQAVDNTPTPTNTPGATTFRSITGGCGIRTDGVTVCWRSTGRPMKPYVPFGAANETFTSISVGGPHGCGLRADGTVVCFNPSDSRPSRHDTSNLWGQSSPPADETFASISAGDRHTCGLRNNGTVVCWGSNQEGRSSPPAGETFTSIISSGERTCGLRADGTPVCWGPDRHGIGAAAAGKKPFASLSLALYYMCGLRANGVAVCWGTARNNRQVDIMPLLAPPSGETFTSISSGRYHTCGIRTDGTLTCWGYNSYDQLSSPAGVFKSIHAGTSTTCGLRKDGVALCWGYYGAQIAPPTPIYGPRYTPTPTATAIPTLTPTPTTITEGVTPDPTHTPTATSVSATDEPTHTPTATPIPTHTPTPTTVTEDVTPDPTHTPTATSVSATDEPTHTPTSTSVSSTGESTPTPTSTTVTDAPTLTPTATGVSTPVGDGLGEFEEQVGVLRDRVGTLQGVGTLNRLIESLRGLINALTDRVAELGGTIPTATPTHTPTPTNTPVTVLETTPTPTATATPTPTATPTRASASTLAPGCIRKTGLGWLTGTWNADCLSDKTPATAKAGTRYARFYTFTLDTASTVTVNISSDDVADTYLYLLEGVSNTGSIVNRGDSRITEQLQAGSYTIEATTYHIETVGNFMLTLDISTARVSTTSSVSR